MYIGNNYKQTRICKHLNTEDNKINSILSKSAIVGIHGTETKTWRTVWRQNRRTPLTLHFLRLPRPHVNAKRSLRVDKRCKRKLGERAT